MATDFGPCADWPVRWICDVSAESPTATGIAVNAATYVLWSLSGRQFGTCSVALRPCRRECYDTSWWNSYGMPWTTAWDYGISGSSYPWFISGCGGCRGSCSCTEISEVALPSPVSSIVSVKLDGAVAPTGSYRLDNNRLLVRTDGGLWPSCNNLNKDDTQVGTWSVTALYGQPVPQAAQLAVGELACELIKAMRGEECRLPPGVTQLTRQGVTVSIPDFGELFKDGRTGLYMVDMFLTTVNPKRLMQRSRVYSVDTLRARRPS
jgi:hypothetical protein